MDSKNISTSRRVLNTMVDDAHQETQVSLNFSDYMHKLENETSKLDVVDVVNKIQKMNNLNEENKLKIARFCALNEPSKTLENFNNFDLHNTENKFEIFKICMQHNYIGIYSFCRYKDLIDENKFFEIAKIFAKKDPEDTINKFQEFNISDYQQKLEIAFKCAPNIYGDIIDYWDKFQINDEIKKYEFIKLCAQKNSHYVLSKLDNLKINSIDQKIEIFKICAKNSVGDVAHNFHHLKNISEDIKFEIVKICAKSNPGNTIEYFKIFGITNAILKDKILKICMHKNIVETTKKFKNFKIDNPRIALEVAKNFALHKKLEPNGTIKPEQNQIILENFLYDFCRPYCKENLGILLLDKRFNGFSFSSQHIPHGLYKSLVQFFELNLKNPELEAIKICSELIPKALEEEDFILAIKLLDTCSKKYLPCCKGGNTQAEKDLANKNQIFFKNYLAALENLCESESDSDSEEDNDFQKEMEIFLLYVSNLFSNLILNNVSAEGLTQLLPAITAILSNLNKLDGLFLNSILCKQPTAITTSWRNPLQPESVSDQNFQILASFLLYKLDANNQANLQATVVTSAAKDVLNNMATQERFMEFIRTFEQLPQNFESQKVAILKRLSFSALERTDREITSLKQEYKNVKLKLSLAEYLGNHLEGNNFINLQKNLYYQVFNNCLKNLQSPKNNNQKTLDAKSNAKLNSFTFENFQEKFSLNILKNFLSFDQLNPADSLLLSHLGKFMQQELESLLKDRIAANQITPEQILLLLTTQLSLWFNKVTGANQEESRKQFNLGIDSRREGIAIRNLITEFSLFHTLINIGGTLALEDFLNEPDQSLPDFLSRLIQTELSLNQSLDVVKFSEVMATWRDPYATLTYAGRINTFADAQKGLGEFLISLVNNNFVEQRYANIGLDNIFSKIRSNFTEKWCDRSLFEQPLASALATQSASGPGLEISLHQNCFSLFKDNLSIHGHLGLSAENLWKEFPLFAKYFYSDSSASQNINGLLQQALQDSEDFPDNLKKNQFQTALIQLIEQPDNYDLLRKAQNTLGALDITCELTNDLSSWKKMLQSRKHISQMNFDGCKVMVTDDPQLLFSMGTDVPGSCQSYYGTPHLCRGLIGTAWDPKAKLVAITDANGRIIGRNVVRLALNESNQPILLLEKQYPSIMPSPELSQALRDEAIAYARMLGCDLVSTEKNNTVKPLDSNLYLGTRRYPAYLDSTGGNTTGLNTSTKVNAWYLVDHKQLIPNNERV
jgi:hypothetical protein